MSEGETELMGEWQYSHISCEDGRELSEAGKARNKEIESKKTIISITNNTMMFMTPQPNASCLEGLLAPYSLLDENTLHKEAVVTSISCSEDNEEIGKEIIGTARDMDFKIQGDKLSIYEPLEYDSPEKEEAFLNCGSDVRVVENYTRIMSLN